MSMEDKVIAFIVDNFEYFRGEQVKYNDKTYKPSDFMRFFANNPELFGAELMFMLTEMSELERKRSFAKGVKALAAKHNPSQTQTNGLQDSPRTGFLNDILENHTLINIINIRGKSAENVLLNNKTNRVSPVPVESVKNVMSAKEWNNYRLMADSRYAHYKPHEKEPAEDYINLHIPAEWTEVERAEPELHEMYKEYFEFLFPHEESREIVYRWILRSVDERCQQYLVLCGKEGSGKSILSEILLKSLHGSTNYFKSKENFMNSNFSGYLEDKTLLFVDEIQMSGRSQLDILKDRINDFIAVEAKGIEQRYIQNYASFVLATNFTNAIHINPISKRRFSVPEITDKKLKEEKGESWIDELICRLSDPQDNANFMMWLRKNYPIEGSRWEVYHGATYEKIIRDSCSTGLKFIVEKIESMEQVKYGLKQLKSEFTGMYGRGNQYSNIPSASYLEQFFNAFTIDGKQIARIEGPYVVPINKYEKTLDLE